MRTAAAILALFLPAIGSATDLELGSGAPTLDSRVLRGKAVLEYCPDNTCERFTTDAAHAGVLKDFAFAYLYGVSDYAYLSDFQAQDLGQTVGALTHHYRLSCRDLVPRAAAQCVAKRLARTYRVTVTLVRFDEGRQSVTRLKWGG